jgi:two-component system, cell cycle response regulator DivK
MAGGRILVAEDNDKSLKLFRDVLQVSGFETLEATTGEQAVELATEWDPDLILMDIRLAGIDGVAALNRLREDQRTAATPVVALTAQAMAGDRERFLEAGFDDYISKPVDVHAFLAVVRRYADARRDG